MTTHVSLYLILAGEESAAHLTRVTLRVTHAHVYTSHMSVQVTAHDECSSTVITGILESVVHLAHVVPVLEAHMEMLPTQVTLVAVGVIVHLVHVMVAHPS